MAVAVYLLSGYCKRTAAEYVTATVKDPSYRAEDPGQLVRDLFLSLPLDVVFQFEQPDPDNTKAASVRATAMKFIAESRTHVYVAEANTNQGIAPSSADAASKYLQICEDLGHQGQPGLKRALQNSSRGGKRRVRKWSQKFRQRWSMGFGSLRAREPLPAAEVTEKVLVLGVVSVGRAVFSFV